MGQFQVVVTLLTIFYVIITEVQDKESIKGYMKRYLVRVGVLVLLGLVILSYIVYPEIKEM